MMTRFGTPSRIKDVTGAVFLVCTAILYAASAGRAEVPTPEAEPPAAELSVEAPAATPVEVERTATPAAPAAPSGEAHL